MLRWWLGDDRLEQGQWFKGRIYERRCDLSPDGDLLIYFAANWKAPFQSWTAVSRTPYLTALALWPKGDAWGGGGLFEGPRVIGLNHRSIEAAIVPSAKAANWHPLAEDQASRLPAGYTVKLCGEYAGRGEDNPIQHQRSVRDGWACIAEGDSGPHRQSEFAWLFTSPEIYERRSPTGGVTLRRYLRAIYQKDGPWYVEDFELVGADGSSLRMIERCAWADWQENGDLLIAFDGCLYRFAKEKSREVSVDPLADADLVADLAALRFKSVGATDWANKWP